MAVDVSSLVRILNGHLEDQQKIKAIDPKIPFTRDFLGGGCSQELDLDLQVPNGYEKRLDLKSGKVYVQSCKSLQLSTSNPRLEREKSVATELQDLNFPPALTEDQSLDLKLFPSADYQSVCTLDKVKSALERAERESERKRSLNNGNGISSNLSSTKVCSPSSLSSQSSPSIRDAMVDRDLEKSADSTGSGLVFAAACPSCLLYVLISKSNPKCPKCESIVPVRPLKKPRIDLNSSI